MKFLWLFSRAAFALSTLATVIGLFNVVIVFLAVDSKSALPAGENGVSLFLFEHIRLFTFFFLFYSVAALIGSIGLMKSYSWAISLWSLLFILGIAWSLGAATLELIFVPPSHAEVSASRLRFLNVTQYMVITMGLGSALIEVWLLKKLRSPEVRLALKRISK